jgi:predicted transport protein
MIPKTLQEMFLTGHWGNGDYEIQISNDDEIEYIFSLIKQFYKMKKQS